MQNIVSLLPLIPVRSEPSDKAEMVTQMIFGERALLLEKQQKWSFVELADDGYRGWICNRMFRYISEEAVLLSADSDTKISGSLFFPVTSAENKLSLYLTAGSLLENYQSAENSFQAGGISFHCLQEPVFYNSDKIRKDITGVLRGFMNIPYLWGGKSPFGMDCSGLTQTVFKLFGRQLPRNAGQQCELGRAVNHIDEAGTGDIAFFDNENGDIIHTGIITGKRQIVHASGYVRLDTLDHKGIYNNTEKNYTHRLRIIKNIIDQVN
jgi:gamma-D-glutamyl-L-lysine dipeptidyl-peptidase